MSWWSLIQILLGSSPPQPVVQMLAATSLGLYPHFTLNCSSTWSGSAATEVEWTVDNQTLNLSSQSYNAFQLLRDGTTSTYDNLLVILISDVNEYSGQYCCSVKNSFDTASKETTFVGNVNLYQVHAEPEWSKVELQCKTWAWRCLNTTLSPAECNWYFWHQNSSISLIEPKFGILKCYKWMDILLLYFSGACDLIVHCIEVVHISESLLLELSLYNAISTILIVAFIKLIHSYMG